MTDHTRRNVLRGAAAVTAAGALVGTGAAVRPAVAAPAAPRRFPFLEGAFAPVTEELTAFDLPVTGRVPRELNGRCLRNGPNVLGLEDPRAHHWMLGDGMVHGVRLREGRAEWYRNRWVRSSQVAKKLGEPYPGPVPRDDFPCNTHVVPYRGRILALQESGPLPVRTRRRAEHRLDRWTVDLRQGRVRTRTPDDRPQEFPRVNEALVSRRHRYGYSAAAAEMSLAYQAVDGTPPDEAFTDALIKHDLMRGTSEVHRMPRGAAASEAVFVPSDPGDGRAAEDDGYAIAYVHDPERGASDLVILAAQDFTGEPVARIHLPGRVPLGFHGSWIPDA